MCAQLKLCSHKGQRFALLFVLTFIYLLFSLFGPSDQGVMDRLAHRCVKGTRMRCCAQWSTLRRGQGWLLGGVGAECGDGKHPWRCRDKRRGTGRESKVNKYKSRWAMLRKCSSFQGHNYVSVVMRCILKDLYILLLKGLFSYISGTKSYKTILWGRHQR